MVINLCFLGLRTTFDTVDLQILKTKLYNSGIRGQAFDFVANYLTNRKQYVELGDFQSDVVDLTHGVPQGSILGPLFFVIYINDLSKSCERTKCVLFADDTSIILPIFDIGCLRNELDRVDSWLKTNKLSLNTDKTKFLHF